jgi:pyridoxine 4-dehydrogenase
MQDTPQINASNAGTLTFGEGLRVHRMGFGAMRLCGPGIWGLPQNPEQSASVLRRAVELGINFIDTAESYGPESNEEQICQALFPYPADLVIATKGGPTRQGPELWGLDCRPERLKAFCEGSIRRLRVEAIDLYYLHNVDPNVPFEDQVGALADLRRDGKIRNVGLSNVSLAQLKRAQGICPIASVQNEYNAHIRVNDNLVDYCEENQIAFMPFRPLGGGELGGHPSLHAIAKEKRASVFQVALAWLLRRSPIMVPIPGSDLVSHVEENIAAASLHITDSEFRSMT